MLEWIILFSVLGSIGSVLAVSSFLLFSDKVQKSLVPSLVSFAVGTLLTAAFLGMIPHAVEEINQILPVDAEHSTDGLSLVLFTVLIGVIVFFILEKLIIWRHCHKEDCELHGVPGPLILIGDAFHNFVDGIVIAASFLVDFSVGIVVSLSVIAHEIPQEVGDFGILLHQQYSKKKALFYNSLSASVTIPAAIFSFFILGTMQNAIPYILAFSAASFIYIALSDLYPELQHSTVKLKRSATQLALIVLGVITMILLLQIDIHP